ncbi:hypothetical protein [Spirosoma areae]
MSLIILVESLIILVESDVLIDELLMAEVVSVTVVVEPVDSVLVLEQPVAKASIESAKNADFAVFVMN